eukprot:SAG11_NODE_1970_length_3983_cov_2.766478_4_plen_120_part_00
MCPAAGGTRCAPHPSACVLAVGGWALVAELVASCLDRRHEVLNVEPTLSINHNWLNAANVRWSWSYLKQQRARIQHEVAGCAQDEQTTQELMAFKYEVWAGRRPNAACRAVSLCGADCC